MQYKVPQNIDMEDKIVGPFTMKQFVYLLITGGLIYAWWSYLQNNFEDFEFEFALLAIPLGLLGFALALVKVNDRPFEYFLLNLIRFIFSPKKISWQEGFCERPVIILEKNQKKKDEVVRTGNLDELAKQLEKSAAILREKEIAAKPQKSIAQLQREGAKLNISIKDQPTDNSQPAAGAGQQTATPAAQPPAQQQTQIKKKRFLGLFG